MEFPIYTPWENLDAQTIQKVINSGINYRTYCDEKPWDVSFEIDFLPKEELIIVVLIEHGRRKGGVSVFCFPDDDVSFIFAGMFFF